MFKLFAGGALMALLMCRPEDAANGAREGLCQWYYIVAPSLFPFMALMPLMTCPEANRFYEAVLGGLTRRLFGLPGSAASPMIVGMLAGSPAGCAAARRVACEEGYTRGQLERVAISCCGLSPGFFISAVGAGLLGDVRLGHVLLRSQLATQLVMLALSRLIYRDSERIHPTENDAAANPVLSIISVAGYMTLFGAIAGALRAPWIQLMLDITAGSRLLCASHLDISWKLPALSALAGYGGLCIVAQNVGILWDCGVNPVKFVLVRCMAGLLAAGMTVIQMKISLSGIPAIHFWNINISCIIAALLAIPVVFRLKRTIF